MARVLFSRVTTGVAGYLGATESRGRMHTRQAIVLAQMAGTFALLAGAALMVRSAQHLADVHLGLDPDHVISANLALHERSYPLVADRQRLIRRVTDRIAALPGVEAAGLIGAWPFAAYPGELVEADVATRGAGDRPVVAASYAVNPAYFAALRLRILEGRALVEADATSAQVSAVVSSALAARLWPDQSPIGRTFRFASSTDERPMHAASREPLTVVGVSADVTRSAIEATAPEVYVSLNRSPGTFLFLQVRATGDAARLVPAIERAVLAEDPNLPLALVQPMTDVVSAEGVRPRFLASVLTAFAALTAAVALVGVYAVSTWIARQRRREAAVRMALGSTASGVVRLFVSRGAWLVWTGVAAGWGLSYLVGGLLESELHGVSASDLTTRAALAAALGTIGVAAVWWPAWRVSRMDAATVLREP
jgi:predicted permease